MCVVVYAICQRQRENKCVLLVVVESPLFIRPHAKSVLKKCIVTDTEFLSKQLVMDYSLLVGIDESRSELVVGIIGESDEVFFRSQNNRNESLIRRLYSDFHVGQATRNVGKIVGNSRRSRQNADRRFAGRLPKAILRSDGAILYRSTGQVVGTRRRRHGRRISGGGGGGGETA